MVLYTHLLACYIPVAGLSIVSPQGCRHIGYLLLATAERRALTLTIRCHACAMQNTQRAAHHGCHAKGGAGASHDSSQR